MNKVIMAESSDIYRDGRVQKEACSLVKAGFDVTVLGFISDDGARRSFAFRLIALPIASRKRRLIRNITVLINVLLLNVRILFMKANVYHAHNTMFLVGMFLASRMYRGKLIYDCHEVQFEAGRVQAWLEKMFIHKADAIINVSEGRSYYQALQHGLSCEQIVVIHNYPELDGGNSFQRKPFDPERTTRLVFSGGFNLKDNRLDDFVRILKGIPNVELDLIAFGYGGSGESLQKLIQDLGLDEMIKFRRLVPFNELLSTLQCYDMAVDMLTNPEDSLSKQYPAINKTYEYFAAGLPIICSDMAAFVNEINNQGAGLSINPQHIETARERIHDLIIDVERMERMRKTVRKLSEKSYNWHAEEIKLITLYANILNAR